MLVLTRKIEEVVIVVEADGLQRVVKVTVLEIRNGRVKLGFEMDDDIAVHWQEVWESLAGELVVEQSPEQLMMVDG